MKLPKAKRLLSPPVLLFIIIALNRLVGLFRSVLLARIFGTGEEAAAFELASRMTASLYEATVGAVIAAMFIPAYVARQRLSKETADRFAAKLFSTLAFVTFLIYIPFLIFPEQLLRTLTENLSLSAIERTALSLRLLSLGKITLSLSALLTGVLQSHKKPLLPATVYATSSAVSLVLVWLVRGSLGAVSLSALLLALDTCVLLFLFLYVAFRHKILSFGFYFPPKPFAFFKKVSGVSIYSAYLPLATLLATLFCTKLGGEEALSANGYATKWVLLSAMLLSSAFHGVYYPFIAQAPGEAAKKVKRPATLLFLLSLAFSALLFLLSKPLFTLLYRGEAFSENALQLAQNLLRLYLLSLPLLVLSTVLTDTAYVMGKTRTLALISLFSLALTLLLTPLLSAVIGLYAVPLAFFLCNLGRFLLAALTVFSPRKTTSPEKIKLMLVLSDANIGGAGRQLLSYLSGADRQKFSITVVLPHNAALAPLVQKEGIPVLFCGNEASFSLSATKAYYHLLRVEKPHILHANASLAARIAALLARVPVRVYTRHCVYPTAPIFRHLLPRAAMRCATAFLSTSVIAVAKEAADNLYDMGVSKKQVTVIENGVPPITFSKTWRELIRNRFAIRREETVAVICARLEPDKDVASLVRAVAIARENEQPITLLVVGQGSEELSLKKLTASLSLEDAVHFCGFVQDVTPYLCAADVYVNCSVGTEATSLAIAEAMSISLPVIATDYGGNPHMVKDGRNGILVPQRCPSVLADALTVMTDPVLRRRFGEASYQVYTARYSATQMAKRNEALYRNLFIRKGYTLP